MKIIGIDIGTTSICGVVLDAQTGDVLTSKTVNSNAFLEGLKFERIQSVEKIIYIATNILDDLISPDTVAIGVTGQMHGIVYVDILGNAVSPLYTWQDERGKEPYKNTTYAEYLGSFSGYGNVTDFYNRENGIRPKNAVSYCTIHDYFVMKLCSLKSPVIHSTNAASFGLYDIEKNKFSYEFTANITTEFTQVGIYKNIPVGVAIGDNQASVFSTLTDEEDLLLNFGTGSQVSIITDKPIIAENIETRPYFDNKYLVVGSALCGGRAYSLLKDFYKQVFVYLEDVTDEFVYGIMGKMAGKNHIPLLVDTRFAGTRSNTLLKGKIEGITTENLTPEALTVGVLHGMVAELHSMYEQMGEVRKGLVGSGNGIRKNSYLADIAQNKFSLKLKTPNHNEEAAVGAALFGGVCAGVFKNSKMAGSIITFKENRNDL